MSTEPRSEGYQRFLESVQGVGPEWQESLDVEALLELPKEERREAEKLLIERIEEDDWRAPPALAAAETRGAVMPMKRRMPKAGGRMKVAMAQALATLEAIPAADPIVAEVLREGEADSGMAAVTAAQEMRSPEIRDALAWASVHHPAPEVRANAGATLFYMAGLVTDPLAWDYRPLWMQLRDEDEAARRRAFEEIANTVGMPPDLAG
ncbi:MAG TPA: hypothetical protein VLS89_11585 [Candidatus Nanopelagicales bacterium]|nr:hypothetical protein [Candidatus Nanopelagicales bacterium]